MKLLRISINGFKSFAEKVNIEIPEGITGIVGPNGSGKSNIVDAVRWVLGEQSLKDLRGGSILSDVIFSGSKTRSSLNRAWVSLTFDNSDQYLKSEFKEIEIKRIVYKTNENEYYINGKQVRLKDITDLFIDSGSSVNSLSIISQGRISEIINSRPEEKRHIIEEAAGVLKYKKRKEETLRKLDKTNDNLSKINLVIDELEINVEPLKEQSLVAQKYLDFKNELALTEISLLANDIESANEEYLLLKEQKTSLDNEILAIDNSTLIDSSKIDTLKLDLLNLEDKITSNTEKLYEINNELTTLATEKQLMIERGKYNVESDALKSNIISLKDKLLQSKNNLILINEEIKLKKEEFLNLKTDNETKINELKTSKLKRDMLVKEINDIFFEKSTIKNKIDIINNDLNNNFRIPFSVKQVINNQRLNGIHNTVANLIETDDNYATAIDTALGFNANVLVVNDEVAAKDAISYLKTNNYGRATFYPLNIIKERGIDSSTYLKIKDDDSFVGIASNLVKYNSLYRKIILNQLGNVIVVNNLQNANRIGRLINFLYKIVTLDGDIIAPGGSITGGSQKNNTGLLNSKKEVSVLNKKLKEIVEIISIKEKSLEEDNKQIKLLEQDLFNSNNKISIFNELIIRKENESLVITKSITSMENEISGNKGLLNNTLDKEIENILDTFYKKNSIKEKLELELKSLKEKRTDLQTNIASLEQLNKHNNSSYNKLLNELKNVEINLTKTENRLDNSLLRLNEEYGMTFEKAKNEYDLEIDVDSSRTKVLSLKQKIKALGEVNTGSISEFERVNTRYTFLKNQEVDLINATQDLLNIINELDKTMEEKLTVTFKELNEEFAKVFKKLFKGGEASLFLSNSEDILTSGLEIKAIPPGKEIKNIKLLSGGEATLTAIALLFSILNIRTVPFCLLDEVEAALDDVNVDMFGEYLTELNTKTQFIIITHKKRTMEYTDNLYGITMQESGVSKLVSVKLNE